jgi:general secretion pathway protein D
MESVRKTEMKRPLLLPCDSAEVPISAAATRPFRLLLDLWSLLGPGNLAVSFHSFLAIVLSFAIALPAYAGNKAESLYKQGSKAESQNHYDQAYDDYSQALALEPKNPKYMAATSRMRFFASIQHAKSGVVLRDAGKLNEAVAEFNRALQIDPTNLIAQMEAKRTSDMLKHLENANEPKAPPVQSQLEKMAEAAGGPIEFNPPSNTPMNMRLTAPADQAYKIIGKLAGVNVLFDPDFKPQKVNIELNDVGARSALEMLAMESKTFWQPISSNTIIVAQDTAAKRKEYEHQVMRMFFMRNVGSSAELQEAAKTVSSILDLQRVQIIAAQNAMIFRGTMDQLILAEKLIKDLDKPKPEVMIEIAVLEVSRDKLQTIGINPPTSASVSISPVGTAADGSSTGAAGSSGGGSTFSVNQFARLTGNNVYVTVPGISLSYLMSDSNSKVLQNPSVRAMDNEKASLKIGDRVPVATGSFTPGSAGGISPLVSTQFQYLDIGVNVDITPHIHSDKEVTLKMSLEISSVTGEQNIGGITQPVIGQRRIEQQARLGDGEVNLIAGILEDTETKSLAGYPYISKLPILRYLFAQEDKERQQSEIVFAITPHIVRAQDITEQNLRLIDVGTATTTGVRRTDNGSDAQGKTGTSDNSGAAHKNATPANTPVARAVRPTNAPATPPQTQTTVPPPR